MRRLFFTEFIGTFFLVFACTGAIIIDALTHTLGPIGTAAAAGLVVTALIYSFSHISGAHFNPAVTVSFWLLGTFRGPLALLYILAQVCGALAASSTLSALFGNIASLGATVPQQSWHQAFCFEFLLTFWLVFVIFGSSVHGKAIRSFAGVAVGAAVTLGGLIGGPVSGASMNPARSFAPALLSGSLQGLWIYLTATLLGAMCAAWLYRRLDP